MAAMRIPRPLFARERLSPLALCHCNVESGQSEPTELVTSMSTPLARPCDAVDADFGISDWQLRRAAAGAGGQQPCEWFTTTPTLTPTLGQREWQDEHFGLSDMQLKTASDADRYCEHDAPRDRDCAVRASKACRVCSDVEGLSGMLCPDANGVDDGYLDPVWGRA